MLLVTTKDAEQYRTCQDYDKTHLGCVFYSFSEKCHPSLPEATSAIGRESFMVNVTWLMLKGFSSWKAGFGSISKVKTTSQTLQGQIYNITIPLRSYFCRYAQRVLKRRLILKIALLTVSMESSLWLSLSCLPFLNQSTQSVYQIHQPIFSLNSLVVILGLLVYLHQIFFQLQISTYSLPRNYLLFSQIYLLLFQNHIFLQF
jgi:hypothetical protein